MLLTLILNSKIYLKQFIQQTIVLPHFLKKGVKVLSSQLTTATAIITVLFIVAARGKLSLTEVRKLLLKLIF